MILLCLVILGANSLEIIHVPSFKNKVFLSGSPENRSKSFKQKDPIEIDDHLKTFRTCSLQQNC